MALRSSNLHRPEGIILSEIQPAVSLYSGRIKFSGQVHQQVSLTGLAYEFDCLYHRAWRGL
jgi:hypothetical protein